MDVLVAADGLDDDGLVGGEQAGALVGVVGGAVAERKKDNVMEVAAAAAVSPIPGTVASDDIVVVAAAGVTGNVGAPMCWIADEASIEAMTRALGSCSLTRIYCCCPRLDQLMVQRQKCVRGSLSLLLLVFFCWQPFEWHSKQAPDGAVVGCVVAEKLGGDDAFVDGAVKTVDDIVNPHYLQQVALKARTVVEESTLQEAMELAGKQ